MQHTESPISQYLKNKVRKKPDFSDIFNTVMTANPKHFLLVDDHPLVRMGIKSLLSVDFPEADFYTATNGKDALEILEQRSIDILTLDISMQGMDGYEAFPIIHKKYPNTRIIILTQYSGEPLIQHFIQLKARAILFKRNPAELTQAIKTVWETGYYLSGEVHKSLENSYLDSGASLPLKERARDLIQHIAAGRSSKEIANLTNLSENTINSYRQDLLRLTRTKNTDELIAFAFTNGLLCI